MLAFIRSMMLMFLFSTILVCGLIYAALQMSESRCADFGDTYGKETVLLANGECRILVDDAELYLPQGMGNGIPSN